MSKRIDKLDELVKIIKAQEELGLAKAKDILADVKNVSVPDVATIADYFKKEEEIVEKKKCNCLKIALLVLAGIAVVAAIVYGLYWYFTPDYLEDFEDDFEEDDFEEDLFEDEDKKE